VTDSVEQDPLQTGLYQLHHLYGQWRTARDADHVGETSADTLTTLTDAGAHLVRRLVTIPGFAAAALEDAAWSADTDDRVRAFQEIVQGVDENREFVDTREKMTELLRRRAQIGRTAIGWALRNGLDLWTCEDVQRYFSQTAEMGPSSFMIPEGTVSSRFQLVLAPNRAVFIDSETDRKRPVEYLDARFPDRVLAYAEDGSEVTLSSMRRLVTLHALQEFQSHPSVPISGDRFGELVREVVGEGHTAGQLLGMYRNVRAWWKTRLMWGWRPIIQQSGGGSGRGHKTEFALNADVLPLSITTQQPS
jgi:hypothetical protein